MSTKEERQAVENAAQIVAELEKLLAIRGQGYERFLCDAALKSLRLVLQGRK